MRSQQQGHPGRRFIALCKPMASRVLSPIVTDDCPFGVGSNDGRACLAAAVDLLPQYIREQWQGMAQPIKREFRDPKVWEIAIAEVVVRSTHNYKDASK